MGILSSDISMMSTHVVARDASENFKSKLPMFSDILLVDDLQ